MTAAAAEARSAQHKSARQLAPLHIAPIGVWFEPIEPCIRKDSELLRLVYAGAIDDRNGAHLIVDIALELRKQGLNYHIDVVGDGPLFNEISSRLHDERLGDYVTLHGFLPEHEQVISLLKNAHVGLAPYATIPESFTHFGDPSKIKAYFAAGLPVVMTGVSKASHEIEKSGGAVVVDYSSLQFSAAIRNLFDHEAVRRDRALRALEYVKDLDWNQIFDDFVERLPRDL